MVVPASEGVTEQGKERKQGNGLVKVKGENEGGDIEQELVKRVEKVHVKEELNGH